MNQTQQVISPLQIRTGEGERVNICSGLTGKVKSRFSLAGFDPMSAEGDFGLMEFHHFAGNGFSIWCSEYNIIRSVDFLSSGDIALLELSIPLEANIYSSWDNLEESFIRDEQFELSYVPFIHNRNRFQRPGTCRTFDIHYSREYLDRFAGKIPMLGYFLEKVDRNEPATLTGRSRFISPAMKTLVQDMLSFSMADKLAGYFYEAGALLMLTMVLDRLDAQPGKNPVKYTDHERESAMEARNLLLSDFSEKYSIRDLARKTGTNESKLQLAFKHFYGTTIFHYAQTTRLDFAKSLLMDTDSTIQSIAERCGYPDNSNLTAAFKKKFGSSPEAFRMRGK